MLAGVEIGREWAMGGSTWTEPAQSPTTDTSRKSEFRIVHFAYVRYGVQWSGRANGFISSSRPSSLHFRTSA